MIRYFLISVCLFTLVSCGPETNCERCSPARQEAELIEIYKSYRKAVDTARSWGYQCGSDSDYVDYGPLKTKLGNCADWAQVSWTALVVKKWDCWKIVKVRARKQFWFTHHNYVYIEPKCGGTKVYLDPWNSGRPDVFVGDAFRFRPGFLGWVNYPVKVHNPGDNPVDPNK